MHVTQYLNRVNAAATTTATTKSDWLNLIREGQAFESEVSWSVLTTLVSVAQQGGHGATIKAIALELYEPGAIAGVEQDVELLFNFACMARDEELLAKFRLDQPEVTEVDRPTAETDDQYRADLEALGLPTNMVCVQAVRIKLPWRRYTK